MRLLLPLQITLLIIASNILYCSHAFEQSMPFTLLLNSHYQDSIILCRVLYSMYQDPLIYKGESKNRNYSEDKLLEFVGNGVSAIQKCIEQENRRVFIFANCYKDKNQKPDHNDIIVYKKQPDSKNCRKQTMITQIKKYPEIKQLINSKSLMIYNIPWDDKNFCLQDHIDHIYGELAHYKAPLLILIDDYVFKRHENIMERMAIIRERFRSKRIISYELCSQRIELYSPRNRDLCTQGAYIFISGMLLLQVLSYYNII